MPGLRCPNCGFQTIEGPVAMTEFRKRLADAYRHAVGWVTGAEIVAHRKAREFTQEDFANEEPRVGIASVKRWELGYIQDKRSNDILVLKLRPAVQQLSACNIFVSSGSTVQQCVSASGTHSVSGTQHVIALGTVTVSVADRGASMRKYMQDLAAQCHECRQTGVGQEVLLEPVATTIPPHLAALLLRGEHA